MKFFLFGFLCLMSCFANADVFNVSVEREFMKKGVQQLFSVDVEVSVNCASYESNCGSGFAEAYKEKYYRSAIKSYPIYNGLTVEGVKDELIVDVIREGFFVELKKTDYEENISKLEIFLDIKELLSMETSEEDLQFPSSLSFATYFASTYKSDLFVEFKQKHIVRENSDYVYYITVKKKAD